MLGIWRKEGRKASCCILGCVCESSLEEDEAGLLSWPGEINYWGYNYLVILRRRLMLRAKPICWMHGDERNIQLYRYMTQIGIIKSWAFGNGSIGRNNGSNTGADSRGKERKGFVCAKLEWNSSLFVCASRVLACLDRLVCMNVRAVIRHLNFLAI